MALESTERPDVDSGVRTAVPSAKAHPDKLFP